MKKFLTLIFLVTSFVSHAQKDVKLSVDWVFKNIIEGYDHNNKVSIFIDGVLVGESSVGLQSKKNSMTVKVSQGKHDVRVVDYAYYQGEWQEHTKDNEYSVDAFYQDRLDFRKKPRKISMVFDIDTEEATIKVK